MEEFFLGIWARFLRLSPTLQPAVLAAATNLALYVLGFIAIVVTAWLARRTALSTKRTELKLDIYERLVVAHDEASDAETDLSSYLHTFMTMLDFHRRVGSGSNLPPPQERWPIFQEKHRRLVAAISALHGMLESWQIIDRRLVIFRMAFAVQQDAIMKAHAAMNDRLVRIMPTENPTNGGLFPWRVPSEAHVDALRQLADSYLYEVGLAGAYVGDLRVEMQRLLLRGIFRGRLERRDAPDPARFALRLDRYRRIRAHFQSTPFFQHGARLDAEARSRFRRKKPEDDPEPGLEEPPRPSGTRHGAA
jgi:hypothetical protein